MVCGFVKQTLQHVWCLSNHGGDDRAHTHTDLNKNPSYSVPRRCLRCAPSGACGRIGHPSSGARCAHTFYGAAIRPADHAHPPREGACRCASPPHLPHVEADPLQNLLMVLQRHGARWQWCRPRRGHGWATAWWCWSWWCRGGGSLWGTVLVAHAHQGGVGACAAASWQVLWGSGGGVRIHLS